MELQPCGEHGRICERTETLRTELDGLFERVNNHLNNGGENHIGRREVARLVAEVRRDYEREIKTVTQCVEKLVARVEGAETERRGYWPKVWSRWGPPLLAALVALTVAVANHYWK